MIYFSYTRMDQKKGYKPQHLKHNYNGVNIIPCVETDDATYLTAVVRARSVSSEVH